MFRGAVRADMARILDIYARAREFMAKNGNPTQWGDNYPSPELLEEDIDTNRLFVYMVNGQMQAVFAFVLGEDPTYKVIEDGQWLNDTLPYGTLHRLASAGESKGIGKAVAEQGWLGVLTGGLSATAGGITTAVVSAVVMALIFKPGDKR